MASAMPRINKIQTKATVKAAIKKAEKQPKKVECYYSEYTQSQLRKECGKLIKENDKLKDSFTCHTCGKQMPRIKFYTSTKTASGVIPTCRECLTGIATNFTVNSDNKREIHETRESFLKALKLADLPFVNSVYDGIYASINDESSSLNRTTIWGQYMTVIQSINDYKNLGWEDSDPEVLGEYDTISSSTKKAKDKTKKFFGEGLKDEDYLYLQDQYDDWTSRHECNTKSQEEVFKQICFAQLDILNAKRQNKPTKDLITTFQNLLNTGNLQPKQNNLDTLSQAQTLGTLIDKWEEHDPIPEPEEAFKDVDNIGLYLDVFYRGHIAKLFGIKNALSNLYDKYIAKYTVNKPEYDEENDQELLFDKVFGKKESDDE